MDSNKYDEKDESQKLKAGQIYFGA